MLNGNNNNCGAESFYEIYNKEFSSTLSFQLLSSLHILSAF